MTGYTLCLRLFLFVFNILTSSPGKCSVKYVFLFVGGLLFTCLLYGTSDIPPASSITGPQPHPSYSWVTVAILRIWGCCLCWNWGWRKSCWWTVDSLKTTRLMEMVFWELWICPDKSCGVHSLGWTDATWPKTSGANLWTKSQEDNPGVTGVKKQSFTDGAGLLHESQGGV